MTAPDWAASPPGMLASGDHRTDESSGRAELELRGRLDRFLAGEERRALRMAQVATGDADAALDIVQDAMMALVQRYAKRPEAEWGPLFQRILQRRITDWYRRRAVRQKVHVWLGRKSEEDREDPIEARPDPRADGPEQRLARGRAMEVLERAIGELPLRQRQAFLLRAWEGLDTKQAAHAMGVSEGSVKTHYFRALGALREQLGEHWP